MKQELLSKITNNQPKFTKGGFSVTNLKRHPLKRNKWIGMVLLENKVLDIQEFEFVAGNFKTIWNDNGSLDICESLRIDADDYEKFSIKHIIYRS